MSSWSWKAGLAGLAIVAAITYAVAQMPSGHPGMHSQTGPGAQDQPAMPPQGVMPDAMHRRMMQMMQGARRNGPAWNDGATERDDGSTHHAGTRCVRHYPGSCANPGGRSRHRLVEGEPRRTTRAPDRHERSRAARRRGRANLDGGIQFAVTGAARTLDAIQHMVPDHVHELTALGWNARTEDLPNGIKLVVSTTDPRQMVKLKALGFMGIMVQGAHHQPHHLMMAKGEFMH